MRFTKLDDAGNDLPADATAWSQVRDNETNLIWTAETIGARVAWKAAKTKAAATDIGGRSDWRLPTIKELLSLVDYERFNPAIDPAFFPDTKGNWYWSSTPVASSPADYAWDVAFGSGHADYLLRSDAAFVRACRSASPASQ